MAQGIYITEAVVLRLADYGDADRVVTLLTAERGKLTALAKGARRSKRRFGAALSPFGHGEATLRERRAEELAVLESLHASRGFPHLTVELGRLSHASYACELCRELCPPGVPEPVVFSLLLRLLGALDGLPPDERPRAEPLRVLELQVLRAVGLQLSLSRCAACGSPVGAGTGEQDDAEVAFDLKRGGVLCRQCLYGVPGGGQYGVTMSGAVRAALLQMEEIELGGEALRELRLSGPVLVACRDLLLGVVQHHLGRALRAAEFIAKVNHSKVDY